MIFIWGSKGYFDDLGESCLCGNCNNRVNLHITNAYTKFTFFFIPLFRIESKYYLTCLVYSHGWKLKRQEAKQLIQPC